MPMARRDELAVGLANSAFTKRRSQQRILSLVLDKLIFLSPAH
jgi:hypothetical protein